MQDNPSSCVEEGSQGETVEGMKAEVSVDWGDHLGDGSVF